jgi:hypothetical protein
MDDQSFGRLIEGVSSKGSENGFETLTPFERVVYCLQWFEFEVLQGGLGAFYMNSSGDHALATIDALEEAGAHVCARVLRKVHRLFPGGSPAPAQKERAGQVEKLLRRARGDVFEKYEEEMAEQVDTLSEMLHAYVERTLVDRPD